MRRSLLLLMILIVFQGCVTDKKTSYSFESENLKLKQLDKNLFTHISYLKTDDFGKVACNGMVYFNKDEAIVFDTPTDDEGSAELIKWIEEKQKKKIRAIVVTHFHNDCLGGLRQFHNKGIRSYASNKTISTLKNNKEEVLPQQGFDEKVEIEIGNKVAYARFFGEGHTKDNVVGYIPDKKALFGGCLIKSMKAGKGYLGDANTAEWSETVSRIRKEIPDLKIIIPGHGNSGGVELLEYTIQMFEEY